MKNAALISLLFFAISSFAQVICPSDITINCDIDYTDETITGQIIVPNTLNNGEYDVNYTPLLNSCSIGMVTATFIIVDSVYCTQTITVENPFPQFDPGVIMFPDDTTITPCDIHFEDPTWTTGACDFIGFVADIDTVAFASDWDYVLVRTIKVIDWCLFDETNGSEGLYSHDQFITVVDEKSPTPFCFSLYGISPSELPYELTASVFDLGTYDDCTNSDEIRLTFSNIAPEFDPEYDSSIGSSIRTYTTEDFQNGAFSIDVYYWDLANNNDFCTVLLSLITSTKDLEDSDLSLALNHPNPFSETTTIEFNLEKSANVTLRVFDLSGKNIFTSTEYYTPGKHTEQLNLSQIANGPLLYRLETATSTVVGKMLKID